MKSFITRLSSRRRTNGRSGLFARLRRDNSGLAAVEFGMIVPIMFFLFVGTIEFSQALTVDRRLTLAASSTADLIARAPNSGLTAQQVDRDLKIIEQLIAPYDLQRLYVKVMSVIAAGTPGNPNALTYTIDWSRDNNGAERFFLKPRNSSCVHLRPINCVTGGTMS